MALDPSKDKNAFQTIGNTIDPFGNATSDISKQNGGPSLPFLGNAMGDISSGDIGGQGMSGSSEQFRTNLTDFKNELLGGGHNDFTPGYALINSGTNQDQLNTAYQHSQGGLDSQRNLLAALQQQNGLGNQTNFLAQQQALANQLQMQAMGQGPNPAMAQLAQATQANTANQAALMAGGRGASSNSGLIARQAAMQGGANQQQMVGQAATMQANQQLAAQQQLQAQQQAMQGVANQQVGNTLNQNTGYNQLAQNQQQMLLNANSAANNANVGMQSNVNNVGAQVSMGNQASNKGILGGVMSGIGAVFGGMAHGGMVPQGFAGGGQVGPQSSLGMFLKNGQDTSASLAGTAITSPSFQAPPQVNAQENYGQSYKQGSQMGAQAGKMGGMISNMFSKGGPVRGQASVAGDSPANDTVPTMLSPGEVVIPRTVMQSKNPAEAAKKFVAALLAKQGKGVA